MGRRRAIWLLALVAAVGATRTTSAQVITPGHEALIASVLQLDDSDCEFARAEIERDHVVAHYSCGDVLLKHASAGDDEDAIVEPFALSGPPRLTGLLAPRVDALASIWSIEPDGGEPPIWRWLVLALLLLVAAGARRSAAQSRGSFAMVLMSLAFVAGAAITGPWGSLHEHNTFIARSDCALDPTCVEDRPGWLPPIYVLYGHLFRMVPYEHAALSALSLMLSLLALLLMNSWLRAQTKDDWLAAFAVLLVALHPAIPRLAAGVTFWPLAMTLVFAALRLSVDARTFRQELGAAAAWSLALTTSVALVLLAPLALWVAFHGVTRKQALRRIPLGLAAMGFVTAFVLPQLRRVDRDSVPLVDSWRQVALFDERIVPLGLMALAALGVLVLLAKREHRGVLLILLPSLALGANLEVGYPTALLHGFGLMFLYGAVAAFPLLWMPGRVRVGVVLAALCTYPLASASVDLAERAGPLREELAFIEAATPLLPPHQRLVIAPAILEPVPGAHWDGDPIEVRFPRGFYAQRWPAVEILNVDQWRRMGAPTRGTLAYFGTSLQVFHPSENGEGERPLLRQLKREFAWETIRATWVQDDSNEFVLPHSTSRMTLRFVRPLAPNRARSEDEH